MTGCIQLGCHEDVCEVVVFGVHVEGRPIQVLMDFLTTAHLRARNSQLVCWVVGFGLAQASTSIGYYSFGAILLGLIEDSSQTSATSISMKLEWLGEICICKNRCCGTESLQVIKGLLTPTVPLEAAFFLPAFSPDVYSCRGWATCVNLGMNWQ